MNASTTVSEQQSSSFCCASKSNRKVTIFGEETSRSACCTTSEPVSAIFLRLPGLAPDRRGSKEGDHPTIYIYIASDRCEIRRLTVGLAGARPNGTYAKVRASLATALLRGKSIRRAVRITMVCSLFACCLSASEAFLFLSGAVCWVFSNAYTKEEHLLVFFVASDRT